MSTDPQRHSIEKAFYHDGFQLALKALENKSGGGFLYPAISEMYAAINELIDALFRLSEQQNKPIECKKGCEWCCHQPVFALDYELDFLNKYIEGNFSDEEKAELREKAGAKNDKFGTLSNDALLNAKFPCPVLKDGACSAYPARPMACRIYLSSDVNTCLKFYREPDDKKSFPALLDLPMRAGRMMNEGFKAALKTNGLVANEFRIEEKLLDPTR